MSKRFLKRSTFQPSNDGPSVSMRTQIGRDITTKFGHAPDILDILDIFLQHRGEGVDKWHHYLPLYARYLGPWRNRPVRFLEIGVFKGGSLEMWRSYLGPRAVIYGVDIDPSCARFDGQSASVRIGSQDDPDFLSRVVDEMGGVDVVLDDGSHVMGHVHASLSTLFPHLSEGGCYIIEDLHAAYWEAYGGGLEEPMNFFNLVREMIDDLHSWYHAGMVNHSATAGSVRGIHIHDSMVVLEKGLAHRPVRSIVDAGTS